MHCIEHGLDPDDIEKGFLLPGKTCGRQIFSRGRGTDSHGDRLPLKERVVRGSHGLDNLGWERRLQQGRAGCCRQFFLTVCVGACFRSEFLQDGFESSALAEKRIGGGGDTEASWHGKARADQLTQIRCLAAYNREQRTVKRTQG